MPLLRLSEAAERCARETGEQVTSDWLLQFAGKGESNIFFIARTVIPLELSSAADTSIIYNIGDYINLPPEWASWMHGSIEKPRTVELSLLPTPYGPRYIKDALTGKRITIKVHEEDLYVSFEEISSMASTLLERRRKDNEESKVLHQQLERQAEEKRKAGRYTLAEAALCIANSAGERKEVIEKKLVRDVGSGRLPAYEPGRNAKMEYELQKDAGGGFIGSGLRMKNSTVSSTVRTFYEEVYWDDLNKWLDECEPRVSYRFEPPEVATSVAASVPTLDPNAGASLNWKMRIQAEAADRWRRAIRNSATPTKNNIKDGLGTWCRENNVKTNSGIYPTDQYIARHVLREWTPPES